MEIDECPKSVLKTGITSVEVQGVGSIGWNFLVITAENHYDTYRCQAGSYLLAVSRLMFL